MALSAAVLSSIVLIIATVCCLGADIIAKVGSTGRSVWPHLYFEFWIDGEAQHPRSYLP